MTQKKFHYIIVNMLINFKKPGVLMSNSQTGRRVATSFISTDRMHRKVVDSFIKTLGLHRSQHMLLMHLNRCGKAFSQKELAEHLRISPTAIAVKIKKLETEGFIKREKLSADGRINKVIITEKGMEIVKKSEIIFSQVDCQMIKDIPQDELEAFISCVSKMRLNLESLLGEDKGGQKNEMD